MKIDRKSNDAQPSRECSRTGRAMPPEVALMLKRKAINARLMMQAFRK